MSAVSLRDDLLTFRPSPMSVPRQLRLAAGPAIGVAAMALTAPPLFTGLGLFGGFIGFYATEEPPLRRLTTYVGLSAVLAGAITLGVLSGGVLWLSLIAYLAVAFAALVADELLSIGGPGPYWFVLMVGVGALLGRNGVSVGEVLPHLGVAVAIPIVLGMGELLVDPAAPRRRAAARAEQAVGELGDAVDASDGDDAATSARVDAALGAATSALRAARGVTADDRLAARLDVAERDLRRLVGRIGGVAPDALAAGGRGDARPPTAAYRLRTALGWPSPQLATFARIAIGVMAAASAGAALDPSHGLWPVIVIVVALAFPGDVRALRNRALIRVLGTAVAIIPFALLLQVDPGHAGHVVLLWALLLVAALLNPHSFILGTTFATLVSLEIIVPLSAPLPAPTIVADRLVDTALGGVIALALLWLIGTRLGGRSTERATRQTTAAARRVLADLRRGSDGLAEDRRRLRHHVEHAGGARALVGDAELARIGPALAAERQAVLNGYLVLAVSSDPGTVHTGILRVADERLASPA